MRRSTSGFGLMVIAMAASMQAQRIAVGIAPSYDAGGDELGPSVCQHLTLFMYQDLLDSKQFAPVLLNPGGVYTPLDTSWLTEYVQDRPDLDLLLVTTLKPTATDKSGSTITIDVDLLDAKTGDAKANWTVSETTKTKNAWVDKGQSIVTNAVNNRSGQYGVEVITPSRDFEKQPIGKTTAHLAEQIRDTLPAHLAGFVKTGAEKTPAAGSGSCAMHTKITYNYRHVASHAYNLVANGLDESLTVTDGLSTFKIPEGPLLLQFTLNDAPYKLSKQQVYQLSTYHSCAKDTLVIDVGQGGDAHETWQ